MKTVTVNASKKYDIIIGNGLLSSLGDEIRSIEPNCRICVVTETRVNALYGNEAIKSLEESGFEPLRFVFDEGEKSKNATVLFELLEFLAQNRFSREDLIVALGGGVVGDLTGFAAAVYLRGIRFIQVPTTLLACVDSSVGGKTAVNLNARKNLAGAFWQPEKVLCDYGTLDTLEGRIFADGMAEVIKYGVIADRNLFDSVKNGNVKEKTEKIIFRCVSIKRDIVNSDELEHGERKLLNFGHTVGHAIEKCSDFKITHGEAVAIGMVIASRAAYKNGLSQYDCTPYIVSALKNNLLPTECEFSAQQLNEVALSDKKISGKTISVIIPTKIGECSIHKIRSDELINFIRDGLEN